jgi:glycosyltransferase involved in cell wall biosynthesis
MNERKPLKILVFSFDWRNIFENDFALLKQKMIRDRLAPDFNEIFIIGWSNSFFYKKIGNVQAYHLKTFFTRVRIIYDFLLIFLTPIILCRKKFKPDIVVIREFPLGLSALAVKLFFKTKIVFFLGTMPTNLAKARSWAVLRTAYHYFFQLVCLKIVDIFLANGQATCDYLIKAGVAESEIKIMVEDVIDRDKEFINQSVKGKIREYYKISNNKKIVFTVSRLEKEKGVERIIKALAELKRDDLILILVGTGSMEKELVNLTHELGVRDKVIFAGYQGRGMIWSYYRDADIFMLLSYSEGNPTVLREAMYVGVPIIGSKIAPIIEFVGEKSERGFVWGEEDGVSNLNQKIELCLGDSEMIKKIKINEESYIKTNIKGSYLINNFIK